MTDVITRADEQTETPPPVPVKGGAKDRWVRRAPLLPALIFAIIVTQVPFLVTIYLSTLGWNALRPGARNFVGIDNYVTVLTDSRLRSALANTVVLTAGAVIFSMILGLALAVLLDRKFPGRSIVRTMLITPFLVMPIAAALLWKHAIYNPGYGLINGIFGGSTDWVSSYPKAAVIATLVWQWTPFMMLILLAGLQSQSEDILEAARVDGASGWRIFTSMTLPHLRQYLELGALLGSIYLVNTFDAVFTITQGGPGSQTTNLPYEIYLTTFRKFEYGEASAAGVIVVL
ncbi:sugar ABC transporter permease, partial [Actinoplanes sp. ATCC 53533]|uniref:carbohydrate ABC transporter permease n=1 Tax=Actinoplanes sp. ATCC 53533 TaxID=1288362 RepID=UPI00100013F7